MGIPWEYPQIIHWNHSCFLVPPFLEPGLNIHRISGHSMRPSSILMENDLVIHESLDRGVQEQFLPRFLCFLKVYHGLSIPWTFKPATCRNKTVGRIKTEVLVSPLFKLWFASSHAAFTTKSQNHKGTPSNKGDLAKDDSELQPRRFVLFKHLILWNQCCAGKKNKMHALGLIIRGGFKPWPCNLHGLSWVCHGYVTGSANRMFFGKLRILLTITSYHGFVMGWSQVCHGCARPEYPTGSCSSMFASKATSQENRQPAEGMVRCSDASETSRHWFLLHNKLFELMIDSTASSWYILVKNGLRRNLWPLAFENFVESPRLYLDHFRSIPQISFRVWTLGMD